MTDSIIQPLRADWLIGLACLLVIAIQARALCLRLWRANLPNRLRENLLDLLKGTASWGHLILALAMAVGAALTELWRYALRHPDQIILDLWIIHEVEYAHANLALLV